MLPACSRLPFNHERWSHNAIPPVSVQFVTRFGLSTPSSCLPQEVQGGIEQGKDVDLFRFEGKEGQRITMEVFAARYGSALDSLLTLYDGEGRILASCDDISGSSDSRLDAILPKAGTYFVGVIDANDQNGPAHVYRLSVRYQSGSARK